MKAQRHITEAIELRVIDNGFILEYYDDSNEDPGCHKVKRYYPDEKSVLEGVKSILEDRYIPR